MCFHCRFLIKAAFLCSLLLSLGFSHDARADAEGCTNVRLNGASDWFPIAMRNRETQTLEGVFPDLAREILGKLQVSVEAGPELPWKRVLVTLENGGIDMITGAYRTEERLEKFAYSVRVTVEEVAVFMRKTMVEQPGRLEDLIGLRGLIPFGASFGEQFDTFASERLKVESHPFDDLSMNMRLLLEGKVDYFITSRQDGDRMIDQLNASDHLDALAWPAMINSVHFLFSRTSPCIHLLEAFDRELEQRIAAGNVEELTRTYQAAKVEGLSVDD
ncbi:transporter substrate-binding domain-containing protein [Rhodobacterales bacterium]|nr:transporter substrate-binding domain-containing protein [Rhodobacterales bacterium]